MSSDRLIEAIKTLYRVNLGIKKGERLLVFTDEIRADEDLTHAEKDRRRRLKDTARLVAEIGKAFSHDVTYYEYKALKAHGAEPPEKLWRLAFGDKAVECLKDVGIMNVLLRKKASEEQIRKAGEIASKNRKEAVNVAIGLANFSTSHTRFRDLLTRIGGARYASMPLFDPDMFFGPMTVDWRSLAKRTRDLARKIDKSNRIILSTPNGTRLSLSKEGRKAYTDTGILTKPGSFSNLPAGEVFLAPLEGTANGRLVIEWAPTERLKHPVTLIVIKGKVREVQGRDRYVEALKEKLRENDDFRNIAELGIGTNEKANRPDNILESEKILGTIHIALGDNSSFGGKVRTSFHQDFIFFQPTLRLIYRDNKDEVIINKGRIK